MPVGVPTKELDISAILSRSCTRDALFGPSQRARPEGAADAYRARDTVCGGLRDEPRPAAGARPGHGTRSEDRYFSGGAYYFATLGAAEFHYRVCEGLVKAGTLRLAAQDRSSSARLAADPVECDRLAAAEANRLRCGDAFMRTIRAYTPADGSLSEQFDQHDGRYSRAIWRGATRPSSQPRRAVAAPAAA